jgi:hypothetical protein
MTTSNPTLDAKIEKLARRIVKSRYFEDRLCYHSTDLAIMYELPEAGAVYLYQLLQDAARGVWS